MANWPVDPLPLVPVGFTLLPVENPLLRYEVYLTGCYSQGNVDLAIMKLQPAVDKEVFGEV